jgi:hypothetical protein
LIKAFFYPSIRNAIFRVDIVSLDEGEAFSFTPEEGKDSLGAIVTRAVLRAAEGNPYGDIDRGPGWRKPFHWPDAEIRKVTFLGDVGGTEFCCVSRMRGLNLSLRHIRLTDKVVIPAGWWLAVASGMATLDGQQGAAGNAFAPRDTDKEVSGDCDILMVQRA